MEGYSHYVSVVFQQIDVEVASDHNGCGLRMYGVTQEGHSVLAHIQDFVPYLLVPAPRGFSEKDLDSFARYLEVCDHLL